MLSDAARELFSEVDASFAPVKGRAKAVRELEDAGLVVVAKRRSLFTLSKAGAWAKAQDARRLAGASC